MREIKFRVWDKERGKIVFGEELEEYERYESGLSYGVLFASYLNKNNDFDECDLMQFTGLHDKNGKEIYESDKIVCEAVDADGGCHEIRGTIEWDYEECGFVVLADGGKWPVIAMRFISLIEVIGNIYESPELFK